jgi:plastocyanin
VTTGSSAQGKQSGTLYWKIPAGISGTYGYLCQFHSGMAGTIEIKAISAI